MKLIAAIILLTCATLLFAQTDPGDSKIPAYNILLTTVNENKLKGILLEVKDSSVLIYPGKCNEWKKNIKYKAVEFGYSNIRELELKRKKLRWKRYAINGSKTLFSEFQKTTK